MTETARPEPETTENREDRDEDIREEMVEDVGNRTANLTENPGDEKHAIGTDGDAKRAATMPSSNGSNHEKVQTGKKEEPKPSKLKQTWGKLGLDLGTCLMMFK